MKKIILAYSGGLDTSYCLKKLSSEGISEDSIKDGENEVQKITDQKINKIEEIINKKEKEIKTI